MNKKKVIMAILLAILCGSAVPTATKLALRELPTFTFTFIRFLIASITILPFFLKDKPKISNDFYKVILFSLFLSANVTLFPIGVKLTTSTIGGMLYSFLPIMVAILSYFFLSEKFHFLKIAGIVIGFSGTLLIILLPVLTKGAPFTGNFWGNLIIFIAVFATAIYTVLSKPFQKNYTPLQLTSFFIFTTTVVLLFFSISDYWLYPHWWNITSLNPIWSAVYVGALGTTLFYILYQFIIRHGSPLIASMLLYTLPATNYFWAAILLGEKLTTGFIIGTVLVCIGIYLTLKQRKAGNKASE